MAKEEAIKMEGIVEEVLPNTTYRIKIANFERPVLASLNGILHTLARNYSCFNMDQRKSFHDSLLKRINIFINKIKCKEYCINNAKCLTI